MAQFDVHRNTGKLRDDIPYVVVIQSALFDDYRRRVVAPLVRKSVLGAISDKRFNPSFKIERVEVVLHPLEIVSIPNEKLGDFVKSLAKEGDRISDALDVLLSRAWG
jgi:toxin CcdB